MTGIVLLAIGLALLWIGLTSTESFADKVHETFTGRYTEKTIRYLVAGGATTLVGGLLALFPARKA